MTEPIYKKENKGASAPLFVFAPWLRFEPNRRDSGIFQALRII